MEKRIKTTNPLRVMLWAPPRSLSTAFERCIASSGNDVRIYHEMYTAAYHLGPERQADIPVPAATGMISEPRFTYEWVQKELERSHACHPRLIFCKELGYTMKNHLTCLPSGYKHTFLIRHPAKVFLSMNKLLQKFVSKYVFKLELTDILPEGLVFRELYELFHYITNVLEQKPIIIDADDLIEYPERTLRVYCRAIGIPFSPSMIQWNPLDKESDRWNYSERLMFVNKVIGQYDRAFSTSKLHKGDEKPMDLTKVTPDVLHATEASVQFYEKLYKLRLRPLGTSSDQDNPTIAEQCDAPSLPLSMELGSDTKLPDAPEDIDDDGSSSNTASSGFGSEGDENSSENASENGYSRQAVLKKLADEVDEL